MSTVATLSHEAISTQDIGLDVKANEHGVDLLEIEQPALADVVELGSLNLSQPMDEWSMANELDAEGEGDEEVAVAEANDLYSRDSPGDPSDASAGRDMRKDIQAHVSRANSPGLGTSGRCLPGVGDMESTLCHTISSLSDHDESVSPMICTERMPASPRFIARQHDQAIDAQESPFMDEASPPSDISTDVDTDLESSRAAAPRATKRPHHAMAHSIEFGMERCMDSICNIDDGKVSELSLAPVPSPMLDAVTVNQSGHDLQECPAVMEANTCSSTAGMLIGGTTALSTFSRSHAAPAMEPAGTSPGSFSPRSDASADIDTDTDGEHRRAAAPWSDRQRRHVTFLTNVVGEGQRTAMPLEYGEMCSSQLSAASSHLSNATIGQPAAPQGARSPPMRDPPLLHHTSRTTRSSGIVDASNTSISPAHPRMHSSSNATSGGSWPSQHSMSSNCAASASNMPRPLSPKYDGQQGEGCPSLVYLKPNSRLPAPAGAWSDSDEDGHEVALVDPSSSNHALGSSHRRLQAAFTSQSSPPKATHMSSLRAREGRTVQYGMITGTRVLAPMHAPPSSRKVAKDVFPQMYAREHDNVLSPEIYNAPNRKRNAAAATRKCCCSLYLHTRIAHTCTLPPCAYATLR